METNEISSLPTLKESLSNDIYLNIGKNLKRKCQGRKYFSQSIDFAYPIKNGPNLYYILR